MRYVTNLAHKEKNQKNERCVAKALLDFVIFSRIF